MMKLALKNMINNTFHNRLHNGGKSWKHAIAAAAGAAVISLAAANPALAANADAWSLPGYDFKSVHSIDLSTVPVKIDDPNLEGASYYERAFSFGAQRAAEKKLEEVKADYNGIGALRVEVEVVQFTYSYDWHEPYVTTSTRSDTRYHTRRVWDPKERRDKDIEVKETRYWTEATPHTGYYSKQNSVVVKVNVYDKRNDKLVYTYSRNAINSDTSRFDLYTDAVEDCFSRLNKLIQGE